MRYAVELNDNSNNYLSMTLPPPVLSRSGIDGTAVRGVQSINHHHYTRKVCISTTQKTEHKTIQSGMKSLMRVFCSSVAVQWNLFITDTLVQDGLSVIKRCPLLGGWFKNASVTHIITS